MHKFLRMEIILIIILSCAAYWEFSLQYHYNSLKHKKSKLVILSDSVFGKLIKSVQEKENNKLLVKNIVVEYPKEWPIVNEKSIYKTEYGYEAVIINNDSSLKILVNTDLNSNSDKTQTQQFYETFTKSGWTKIIVAGNEGVRSAITTFNKGNTKTVITAYVTSPEKNSQFSIVLESLRTFNTVELNELFDAILGSISFR